MALKKERLARFASYRDGAAATLNQPEQIPIVDFTKSQNVTLAVELVTFIRDHCSKRRKKDANNLSDALMEKIDNVVTEKRGIAEPQDLQSYFSLKYIAEFEANRDRIKWCKAVASKGKAPTVTQEWQVDGMHRKVILLRELYNLKHDGKPVRRCDVMPPVYVRDHSSKKWRCTTFQTNRRWTTDPASAFPAWITGTIIVADTQPLNLQKFLTSNDNVIDAESDEGYLEKDNACVVYYLVVHNTDYAAKYPGYPTVEGMPSPLQIYIGKAKDGVRNRWMDETSSHCAQAAALVNSKKLETFYDYYLEQNSGNESFQLVDVYLALAYLKGWDTALFVVFKSKDMDDSSGKADMEAKEAELIQKHDSTNDLHGLNVRDEATKEGYSRYVITTFTGTKKDSGTDSKVFVKLHGEKGSSENLLLADYSTHDTLFESGTKDTFTMPVKSLGRLTGLRVWHDNSGKQHPGWFLEKIEVRDKKKEDKGKKKDVYTFSCNQWLATDKGDHSIARDLCAVLAPDTSDTPPDTDDLEQKPTKEPAAKRQKLDPRDGKKKR